MIRASRWWFLNPLEWLKLAYETFGVKHPTGSLIGAMVLCALLGGAVWLLAGKLHEKSSQSLEGPTFKEKVDLVRISMGTNGQTMATPFDRLRSGPLSVFSYGRNPVYNLIVMSMDKNRLYVDVKLAVPPLTSPLEIKHNEFVIQPPGWDRNSNKAALEFVDERQVPVFQMIYLNNYHVQLNGIIALPEGFLIADKAGFHMLGRQLVVGQVRAEMDRIFRYPSWKYPGEFETPPPERPPASPRPEPVHPATQAHPAKEASQQPEKEKDKDMPKKTDRSVKIGDGNTLTNSPIITGDVNIGDPIRNFTQTAGEAAVKELSAYKNTRFVIEANPGTSEPGKFANQIMAILIAAEWAPKQRSVIPTMSFFAGGPGPPGVLIYATPALMPAATALATVLRRVDPSVLCQDNGSEDLVKISVLPRP